MRKSEINLEITLDSEQVPDKIRWQADDSPADGWNEVKAIALALWDSKENGTLKIDLWTKEMEVYDMKRFFIETISGMADTIRKATADEVMAMDMENLCKNLTKRLEEEMKMAQR
jgi:gliding motility-associated protein GldC